MGRTGTLITIDCVMDQIQKEGVVDIAGIIKKLRNQRMKMVQSPVCVCVHVCELVCVSVCVCVHICKCGVHAIGSGGCT